MRVLSGDGMGGRGGEIDFTAGSTGYGLLVGATGGSVSMSAGTSMGNNRIGGTVRIMAGNGTSPPIAETSEIAASVIFEHQESASRRCYGCSSTATELEYSRQRL